MQCQGKDLALRLPDGNMKTAAASARGKWPRVKVNRPVALKLAEAQVTGIVENASPSGAFISVKGSSQLEGHSRMVVKPPNCQVASATAKIISTKIFTPDEIESCL